MTSEAYEQLKLEEHIDDQLSVRKSVAEVSSEKIISRPLQKRKRVQGEKNCQICGDKALAHHFGVLSCETCKAFFRRNALKPQQETRKCVFQGNCCIDKKTRRFCPPCRLRKCFDVGMHPELILREEERQARMKQTKKALVQGPYQASEMNNTLSSQRIDSTSGLAVSPESVLWPGAPSSAEHIVLPEEKSTADQCPSDRTHDTFRKSFSSLEHPQFDVVQVEEESVQVQNLSVGQLGYMTTSPNRTLLVTDTSCPTPVSSSFLMKTFLKSPGASVSGSSYRATSPTHAASEHHPDEVASNAPQGLSPSPVTFTLPAPTSLRLPPHMDFQHVTCDQIPSDPFMFWRLTEEERSLLAHLSSIYQDTVLSILKTNPLKESMPLHMLTKEMCLVDYEAQTRNVIHFAKKLQDFRQLSIDDQIAILKASNSQVLGIRSCAVYISEKEAWLHKYGYLTLEHSNHLFPDYPYNEHEVQWCKVMKKIVKNDTMLYALLHCVVLFNPSDERITDRQLVNIIRGKFLTLLHHYLESVYSYYHSDRYLLVLQELLQYLRDLCLEFQNVMKIFFPNISNKLLVELYDLDQ